MIQSEIHLAAKFIKECQRILIGTGAGMGRDSGLPDFRGNEGFWNHYPPYRGKFNFYECANPQFLAEQPHLFWGFYGSRLQMYRKTIPHQGFNILKQFELQHKKQIFTLTSNVDGQHKKAGFNKQKIYEVHGSIHHLQCQSSSCSEIKQNKFIPKIDHEKMICENLPICQKCEKSMRPNILMFNDYYWDTSRSDKQESNFQNFLIQSRKNKAKLCMIQIGCGPEIPTIRNILGSILRQNSFHSYIRLNPDQQNSEQPKSTLNKCVHIKSKALEALQQIKKEYSTLNKDNV